MRNVFIFCITLLCALTTPVQNLLASTTLASQSTSDEPSLTVTPASVSQVTAYVGESKVAATFTVQQANLSGPVAVYLSGKDALMFTLDKESLSEAEETVTLTYTPTKVGSHTAYVYFDPTKNSDLFTMVKVTATASEASTTPEITLNPTTLPHFTCAVGETVRDTVRVSATHCSSYITISLVNDGDRAAFTVNNTLMPANTQNGLSVITFHPLKAGEYSATVWYQTDGGTARSIRLTGTATAGGSSTDTYATDFSFTNEDARAMLIERFDAVGHNTPLALTGWQNVVKAGNRPWWGIDQVNDEDMHCAKATAFVSGQTEDTEWEQWLVTPALDYQDAANQVFTFRVRGDYLFDEMTTSLTLFYIDATDATDIYMQPLEVGIPATADESGEWVDIHVNLTGQTTIADVFYMAFRYKGPSGINGAPTYYVDDVTWGNPELPIITSDSTQITFTTAPGIAEGVEFHIAGSHLTEEIKISLVGDDASSFSLATEKSTQPEQTVTLPKQGGLVAIALIEDIEGVYETYVAASSRGAATLYIPVACLVQLPTGTPSTKTNTRKATKRIENSQLLILHNGQRYNALGHAQ